MLAAVGMATRDGHGSSRHTPWLASDEERARVGVRHAVGSAERFPRRHDAEDAEVKRFPGRRGRGCQAVPKTPRTRKSSGFQDAEDAEVKRFPRRRGRGSQAVSRMPRTRVSSGFQDAEDVKVSMRRPDEAE
ncbi:hypothetical protein NDU88_003075 [Pleurodeles waltl]|uniref:Uncharacterized protein n=1 Tax=Pleurodeles waltl TaxID=8319 RepID=A0AAV7NPX1_PLEWA|nr:hypothetical protein NDU88_003075 [Pleurodeles waltl]